VKFVLGDKIIFVNLSMKVVDTNRVQLGLNSGKAFKGSHFLFLDYDEYYPEDEFHDIILFNSLRRGIIVESSPSKFHALSFSPLPYAKMLEITSNSNCDSRHKAATINNGFATLRFTPKRNHRIRVVKVLENPEGKNFYSYRHEELYTKRLIVWESA